MQLVKWNDVSLAAITHTHTTLSLLVVESSSPLHFPPTPPPGYRMLKLEALNPDQVDQVEQKQ